MSATSAAQLTMAGPSITNHVVTLAHPTHPHFLTQIVHLRSPTSQDSLFVHCTAISSTLARSLSSSNSFSTTAGESEEDAELQAALIAAGRAPEPTAASGAPFGALAADFALAMAHPSGSSQGTPILTTTTATTTSSLAASMSKRLASKLRIPHLLLSLDLPPSLIASPGRIQSPEDSRAVLILEKAIRDACTHTLSR
ncbi:hypothetical protein PSEUBRA_003512 [Kalmanozyma brasiliensis GHG001]|uniref:Uncharacterized protein n=1 Tax=Kalmanozyma brasiliensis (strain GHG001) TaxID=1365824 RepID=V5EV39_KALBG|nr:uncharacterized protein PSEUBRA_003512 [Kalmanozyma brasiliensis GHG001]EST07058.1 hypothetical protein PSEUBRA_003512 [Kalmanozyma brasiliensis GHG001]